MSITEFIGACVVATLGSNSLWSFLQARFGKKSNVEKAVLALAHDRLYQYCEQYIKKGSIRTEDLDNVTRLYEGYTALGGNSTGTSLYNRVKELPLE